MAEHSYRMALIAFFIAEAGAFEVNKQKLLTMCLLHDLPEARTGDHNYVNKRYVHTDNAKLMQDIHASSPFGAFITELLVEYDSKQSIESILAHDADQLELLLALKEEHDLGNPSAMRWFNKALERLHTPLAKNIAAVIQETPFDSWWAGSK